jgi:hypothetical protein
LPDLVSFKVVTIIEHPTLAAASKHIKIKTPPVLDKSTPLMIGPAIPPILEKMLKKLVPVDLTWVGKDSELKV